MFLLSGFGKEIFMCHLQTCFSKLQVPTEMCTLIASLGVEYVAPARASSAKRLETCSHLGMCGT